MIHTYFSQKKLRSFFSFSFHRKDITKEKKVLNLIIWGLIFNLTKYQHHIFQISWVYIFRKLHLKSLILWMFPFHFIFLKKRKKMRISISISISPVQSWFKGIQTWIKILSGISSFFLSSNWHNYSNKKVNRHVFILTSQSVHFI